MSETARKSLEEKLASAKKIWQKDTTNADAIIWLGRRTAYLGEYIGAIDLFTRGIVIHPSDARMYRHRGHRYLTIRNFDKAIADFEKAAKLVKGKTDEIEPDGMPNAQNIPTSTLQTNIYYHLGLAYFLKGNFQKAIKTYEKCLTLSKNDDMYMATANWLNLVLQLARKSAKANQLLATINPNKILLESGDYLKILMLYKNHTGADELYAGLQTENDNLSDATTAFGLAMYYHLNQQKEKSNLLIKKILAGNQWSSFGFIAAEAQINRR
ncbi:MAG: tetratricopeptide repeat protein [Phycisphaerales bacterium]|nr:tetratricopeptide repeat protein [Phycisphaerales bacterium]